MKELKILSPDGQTRLIPLSADRLCLGRSTAVDLSFPEDAGLSRQHLALEREADGWIVLDLGSKNGTTLNGARINGRMALKSGDKIAAGHLVLVYDSAVPEPPKPVVVFDGQSDSSSEAADSTVVTSLDGVLKAETPATAPQEHPLDATHVSALVVSSLVRAGNELAGNRPLAELFPFILDLAISAVQADRGVLMTTEGDQLIVRANKGEGFRISSAVRDRVLNSGLSVLVRDTSLDDALRDRRSIVEQNIRTLMAVPLQTHEKVIGLIYVDSPSLRREFSKDDLNLLTVMANVAAIRIEQTRFAEIDQARQLLARDLEQAAEIQKGFLPAVAPSISGVDIAGYNAPCRTVGGDYYDFFPYGKSRISMVLGDVSGKGMPASLLMMGLQARVQVLIEEPKNLGEVMTRLNRITSANCPSGRFITLFLCVLDGETGDLTFCNAGHNPPLIVRSDGTYQELKGAGPIIGIVPFIQYEQHIAHLNEDDVLVIFSDGVTEARNSEGEEFEIEGLAKAVIPVRNQSASGMIARINEALLAYTGGLPPADDVTVVVARRLNDLDNGSSAILK